MKTTVWLLLVGMVFTGRSYAEDAAADVAKKQQQDAAYQLLLSQYLMKQMAETKDAATKNSLMMMMMQSQMQAQSSAAAAKKNKENSDKKSEKGDKDKAVEIPMPSPPPKSAIEPVKPEENLNMVESAAPKKGAAQEEVTPTLELPTFTLPKVPLNLSKAPEPTAVPALVLSGEKTALTAIAPKKEESISPVAAGIPAPQTSSPSLISSRGAVPGTQDAVTREVASINGNATSPGIRKTAEKAGLADSNDSESSGGSEGGEGGSGSDDFFASLMEKMNAEESSSESANHEAVGDAEAGEPAPMSIFEYASLRFHQAAYTDGRVRPPVTKK